MKRFYSILTALFISINLFSQSGFSYQGVLRDTLGKLRANENLNLSITLLQNGKTVYTETQHATTNSYGVFSIVIGNGNGSPKYSASLFLNNDSSSINTTILEVKEGKNVISSTQILGVPFAEVANVALKAHIDFPAGTIIAFGGNATKIPSGWLLCDGTLYDQTAYPDLFKAISSNWGGEGTKFRVPDLRGVFLRGVNSGNTDTKRFYDPDAGARTNKYDAGNTGNTVGSFQVDTLGTHSHKLLVSNGGVDGSGNYRFGAGNSYTLTSEPTGSNETRPVNAYVYYIIKY
jgi:microcystin-dependent protein